MPLFGVNGIKVPVSIITDADPQKILGVDGKEAAHYPAAGEAIILSANTSAMKVLEDEFVKVFHGLKTFEYDFALVDKNRAAMLAALKDIHPTIGKNLEAIVNAEPDDRAKATALFKGMFERAESNVQKGKFAQALAAKIVDDQLEIAVPEYIAAAIRHVCQK